MFRQYRRLLNCALISKIHRRGTKIQCIDVFINGKPVNVPSYYTVLQALRRERVAVPSFCYHERLSIAGNCRMCLVEIEGMFKPQIACAMPVTKHMRIRTNSALTLKAQESVLEFILADHPLDCPICDQGGECDLQDLSMKFGNDRSRFTDIHFSGKRASENKYLGPFIRTEMTRCIHCTRCIRFASQVCGLDVLGSTGRGSEMLVGTYVDRLFLSELSGNIIDLCPVGALTAIPYMFKARPWEVIRTNSIDVTDATGTNIVINHRFDKVLRVLPREYEEVNQEWLSDKGRWAIDSLEIQRLVTPLCKVGDCLLSVDWHVALCSAADIIKKSPASKVLAIAGPYCNVETLVAAKDLLNTIGSEHLYVERALQHSSSKTDLSAAYSLNINMKQIADADKILLVGTNPRFEAPILNAWIRQAYIQNECDIFYIGSQCDFNYHVKHIGHKSSDISKLDKDFMSASKPLIFVGISQLEKPYAGSLMDNLTKISGNFKTGKNWNILNIIPREASWCGALEAGWKPGAKIAIKNSNPEVIISLGADEVFYDFSQKAPVIYIGFQGDKGAEMAEVVLPGSAYTESGGVYMNMEGRAQQALPAVTPPGKARVDWKIIRALAEYCGVKLPFNDADSMLNRMGEISPNFVTLNTFQKKSYKNLISQLICSSGKGSDGDIEVDMKKLQDYYCSDIFTFNSPNMVRARKAAEEFKTSRYAKV